MSNEYRKLEVEKRLVQLQQLAAKKQEIAPEGVDMTNIRAFYIQQGNYIDATRDEILKTYGSIDRYVTEGIGLTNRDIDRLRDRLLEQMSSSLSLSKTVFVTLLPKKAMGDATLGFHHHLAFKVVSVDRRLAVLKKRGPNIIAEAFAWRRECAL